jgi:nucleoside-diphosphate-sugar epimerase
MKNNRVIGITGGTGALGRRLTELAVKKGFTVKCLVRNETKKNLLNHFDVEICDGDITKKESLKEFVKGLEVCIHLAAHVGHGTKKQYELVNIKGTENLCKTILDKNPKCQFIQCSSISALKAQRLFKFLSTHYGKSKLAGDQIVKYYATKEGLKATTIYPGLIYGPYDNHFVPLLIKYLKQKRVILITGGEKKGPVIYIDDLCNLFLTAAVDPNSIGNHYLGVGDLKIGIHDFIATLAKKLDCSFPKFVFPKAILMPIAIASEMLYSFLRIDKAPPLSKRIVGAFSINFNLDINNFDQNLNWSPMVSVPEGIDRALEWRRNNLSA